MDVQELLLSVAASIPRDSAVDADVFDLAHLGIDHGTDEVDEDEEELARRPLNLNVSEATGFNPSAGAYHIVKIVCDALEDALVSSPRVWIGQAAKDIYGQFELLPKTDLWDAIIRHWLQGGVGLPSAAFLAARGKTIPKGTKGIYIGIGWLNGKIWAIYIGKSDDVQHRILEHQLATSGGVDMTPLYRIARKCDSFEYHLLLEVNSPILQALSEMIAASMFQSIDEITVTATVVQQVMAACRARGMPTVGCVPCNYRIPLDPPRFNGFCVQDEEMRGIYRAMSAALFKLKLLQSDLPHDLTETIEEVTSSLAALREQKLQRLKALLLVGLQFRPPRRVVTVAASGASVLTGAKLAFLGGLYIGKATMDQIDEQLQSAGRLTCNGQGDANQPGALLTIKFVETAPNPATDLFPCWAPVTSTLLHGMALLIDVIPVNGGSATLPSIPVQLFDLPQKSAVHLRLAKFTCEELLSPATRDARLSEANEQRLASRLPNSVDGQLQEMYGGQCHVVRRGLHIGGSFLGKWLEYGSQLILGTDAARAVRFRPSTEGAGCTMRDIDYPVRILAQFCDYRGDFSTSPVIELKLLPSHFDVLAPMAWKLFKATIGGFSRIHPPPVANVHFARFHRRLGRRCALQFPQVWEVGGKLQVSEDEAEELGVEHGSDAYFFLDVVNVPFEDFAITFGVVGSSKTVTKTMTSLASDIRLSQVMTDLWKAARRFQRLDENRGLFWPGRRAAVLEMPSQEWAEANYRLSPAGIKRKWEEENATC